ncbi:protein phosphatase 1 regulatory subunit 12A isoform X2 [Xenopus laevis]|uniref:Protein phosphatase 1 regulatory subunit n=1 Tax=Xenopus laevis TaxID=8355 RepID=A0A8J1MX42_XENLA|nr:protein phosphatase 1 regulatory subunit 12A isoform X2 [Xenopus laevis]
MAADDRYRSDTAKVKRKEQLNRWMGSETERCMGSGTSHRPARVRFAQGAVFMAACSAGDRDEVRQLLTAGAPINGTNVDGLTALHQACIDENLEMVQFLVENGSNVNQPDNEGWTPLHAAASCGFVSIAQYLIANGASVAAVNSEGELPLDVSHESAMEKLLKSEVKKQGVDPDVARREEEEVMLRDVRHWLNSGKAEDIRHPTTGATALHVAAAKGYTEVIRLLLQLGFDVDARDFDGWTPLHAATHWGQEDACRLLVEALCDMEVINKVGQTAIDVADESLETVLEELKKKQSVLRLEKKKTAPQILNQSSLNQNAANKSRSQEKVALRVQDKERRAQPTPSVGLPSIPTTVGSDAESGSDTESQKVKAQERINNLNNQLRNLPEPAAKKASVVQEQEKSEPASGSWRASLRKTGSTGALSTGTAAEEGRRAALPKSASSSQLSEREKAGSELRLARVPPNQKLQSNQENARDSVMGRGSYLRQRTEGEEGISSVRRQWGERPAAKTENSIPRREPLTAKSETPVPNKTPIAPKEENLISTPDALGRRTGTTNAITTNTEPAVNTETKERRRSYLTPVRDEEAEAQRKARSRHARQSRRSTQGVTLTDLKEAEKVMKGQQDNKEAEPTPEPVKAQEEENNRESQVKARTSRGASEEGTEVSWRARIASLQKSDLLGLTTPDTAPTPSGSNRRAGGQSLESKEMQKSQEDEKESDEKGGKNKAGVKDRRRPRGKRRSTGVPLTTRDSDEEDSEDEEGNGDSSQTQVDGLVSRADSRSNTHTTIRGEPSLASEYRDTRDFKKLYEEQIRDNGRLRSQLLNTQNLVNETKAELERAQQRQERSVDRSFLIDTEKKEKVILERRLSELQEELKVLGDLKADNQRLKDENGALIRVISKLSK